MNKSMRRKSKARLSKNIWQNLHKRENSSQDYSAHSAPKK
jgi:hypothetical protein